MEYKNGNTFATVAFGSYGLFWYSFVILLILPKMGLAAAPDVASLTAYLFMWGVFTAVMFIGTLKISRGLQAIFGTLAILFFLLALGEITETPTITLIAGYEGILTGLINIRRFVRSHKRNTWKRFLTYLKFIWSKPPPTTLTI